MLNIYSQLNNGFGPIFDERKNREWYIMLVILIFICLMTVPSYFNKNILLQRSVSQDLVLISMIISSLLIGEFLRRIAIFFEEIFHVETRYKGSFKLAFYKSVAMATNFRAVCVIFILTILVLISNWKDGDKEIFSFTFYVTNIVCSSFVMHLLNLKQLSPVEYSHLNEIENKHLGVGLAWGYYFGYLKEQLPKLKSLVEGAMIHSVIEGNARKHLKPILYIIIPRDCYCRESFESCDNRIKFQFNSLEDKRNVNGVHEQSFKSSVYSIEQIDREPKYIIMEYAKPIKNLYQMSRHLKAGLSNEDVEREVNLFYRKLKNILEGDFNCIGHYKLILINSTIRKNNLVDILYKSIEDDELFCL